MLKPIKPNVTLPDSFGGEKYPFSNDLVENGYEKDIPQIIDGGNLNQLIDDVAKSTKYNTDISDIINNIPIGKFLTSDENNNFIYDDLSNKVYINSSLPFSINSGNVDTNGNADILYILGTGTVIENNYSVVGNCVINNDVWTGGTSRANYINTGYAVSGSPYEISFKFKTIDNLASNMSIFSTQNINVWVGTNNVISWNGNQVWSAKFTNSGSLSSNTMYWLKLIYSGTLYTLKMSTDGVNYTTIDTGGNGVPSGGTLTLGAFNSSGGGGLLTPKEYYLGDCYIIKGGVEVWRAYKVVSVFTATDIFFKVGNEYPNLVITYANGKQENLTYLSRIENMTTNGIYTIIKEQYNNAIAVLSTKVGQGKTFPPNPINGDYHCLTATGLKTYKRVDDEWVETQYVPIGTATLLNGAIQRVSTALFNDNGAPYNKVTISGLGMPSNRYIDLTLLESGSTYVAPANGYFSINGYATGSLVNCYIYGTNLRTQFTRRTTVYGGNALGFDLEVAKGDTIKIEYEKFSLINGSGLNPVYFRFYYAEGNK